MADTQAQSTPFDGLPDGAWAQVQDAWSKGDPWIGTPTSVVARLNRMGIHPTGQQQSWWMGQGANYSPQEPQGPGTGGLMGDIRSGIAELAPQVKYGVQAVANTLNPFHRPQPNEPSLGAIAIDKGIAPVFDMAKAAALATGAVMTPGGEQALTPPNARQQLAAQGQGIAQAAQQGVVQPLQQQGVFGPVRAAIAHPINALNLGMIAGLGAGALHGAGVPLPSLPARGEPPAEPPAGPDTTPPTPEGPQPTVKFKQPVPVEHTPTGQQGEAIAQTGDTVTVRSNGVLYKVPQAELRPLSMAPAEAATTPAPTPASTPVPSPRPAAQPTEASAAPAAPAKSLSPEVQSQLDQLNAQYQTYRQNLQKSIDGGIILPDEGAKQMKGLGMQQAAQARQITGDLTPKEQAYANRPYQKGVTQVQLPDGTIGTYQGHVFGQLNVDTVQGRQLVAPTDVERLGNTPDEVQAATGRMAQLRQNIHETAQQLRPILEQEGPTQLGSGFGGFDMQKVRAAAYDLADRVLQGHAGNVLEAWEGHLRDFGDQLGQMKDAILDHAQQLLGAARIGQSTEGALPPGTPETGGIAPKPIYPEGSLEALHHDALAQNPTPEEMAQLPGAPVRPTSLDTLRGLLQAGMGYRNWYQEYGSRLFRQLGLMGGDHALSPDEVQQLTPEIRAVWATTAASASPFQNLRSTLATMATVREMMHDGSWDATDPTGTAKTLWKRLNAQKVFLSGKAGRPGDQTGQLFRLYNEGRIGTSGAKIVSFGIGTHEASEGQYSPFPVIDRHIIRASGLDIGTSGSVPDASYRFVASVLHHLAAERGVSPLQAQAAMWEPARIIGDDYYRLAHDVHLKDGTVIPAGQEVAAVARDSRNGTLMIRHPDTLENKALTLAQSQGATRTFEGVKSRIGRGIPEGQAVEESYQEAMAQHRFQSAGDMGDRVRSQVEGEFNRVQPLARKFHQSLELGINPHGPEPPERIYEGQTLLRPGGAKRGKGVPSPYVVTPETSRELASQVAERSPTLFISGVPGAGAYPEASEAIHNAVWSQLIDPQTGRLKALDQAGIAHEVLNTQGHGGWEGQYDPSLRVRLIGATTDTANQVASLYGPMLGQDAVAVYVPDAKVPSINVASIGFDHPITREEFTTLQRSFAADGFDIQTSNDGRSLEVLHFPDAKQPQGTMAWYNSLYDAAENAGLAGAHIQFKPGYSYLVGTGAEDVPYRSLEAPLEAPGSAGSAGAEPPGVAGGGDGAGAEAGVPGQPSAAGRSLLQGTGRGVAADILAGTAQAQLPAGADPALAVALAQMKARLDHLAGQAAGLHSFPGRVPQLFIDGDNLKAFLQDARVIGSHYLQAGLSNFNDWSAAVYNHLSGIGQDLAEALRPHLPDLWRAALRQAINTPGVPDKAGLKRLYGEPVQVPTWIGLSDQPGVVQTALSKITRDPTGQLALSQALQAAPPQLRTETLAQTANRARQLADQLRIDPHDPDIAINRQAVEKMSGVEINALMNLVKQNTDLIAQESRRLSLPDNRLSDATRQMSQELIAAAHEQNNSLLGQIVEARSQKGRDLGSLRLLAQASNDPEVWMVQAKQALGERPLTPAIQNDIYRLAGKIKEVC